MAVKITFLMFFVMFGYGQANVSKLHQMDPKLVKDLNPFDLIDERIVGGYEAPEGAFPYQISMRKYNRHFCGGSILNNRWIITAAHCVVNQTPEDMTIVVGTNTLKSGGTSYPVEKLVAHEDYSSSKVENDIALVRVVRQITFGELVQPIELPTQDSPAGTELTLTGWGKLSHPGTIPNKLQTIQLTQIDTEECTEKMGREIFKTNVCTVSPFGQGACHGDSGGPLVDGKQLVGVVSWGVPCARGRPDVFTRVYSYLDWISSNAE